MHTLFNFDIQTPPPFISLPQTPTDQPAQLLKHHHYLIIPFLQSPFENEIKTKSCFFFIFIKIQKRTSLFVFMRIKRERESSGCHSCEATSHDLWPSERLISFLMFYCSCCWVICELNFLLIN